MILTLAGVTVLALLMVGCAAGANPTAWPGAHDAGFWLGLWQGFVAPITLQSLVNHRVGIYEVHNTGGWYNFGFLRWVSALFSGAGRDRRRRFADGTRDRHRRHGGPGLRTERAGYDCAGEQRGRSQLRSEAATVMARNAGTISPTVDLAEPAGPDMSWASLYRAGGLSALLFVLLVLVPIVLVFVAPVPPVDGRALLAYIAAHKIVYLTELVCFVGLSVPALVLFGALAVALKGLNKSMAAIGGLFGIASETIALALGSSPQSLHGGLVVLSDSYLAARTDAERAGLVSAADALIAATNAVSWAGILTAAGILVLSQIMRRGYFGSVVGILGVVTGAAGIVSEAFRPMIGPAYLLYGLLLPTWFALVGWKLLRLDRRRTS